MTTLFPEIALGSLRPIRAALSKTGPQEAESFHTQVLELAKAAQGVVNLHKSWWDALHDTLSEGISGIDLRVELAKLLDSLSDMKSVATEIGQFDSNHSASGKGSPRDRAYTDQIRAVLASGEESINTLIAKASALQRLASAPPSPEFAARAKMATAPDSPAEYESLDSILARLHAGGDL